MMREGNMKTSLKKGAEDERQTYAMYYEYEEKVKHIKPHRILAINRGESEKVLSVKIDADKDAMASYIKEDLIKRQTSPSVTYITQAIEDSIKRLIYPSLEREIRAELSELAEDQAIEVFAENLNKLLLQPPLKGKMILGIDPAFRTGCKLSVVDQTGNVLIKGVIYPHEKSKGSVADSKDIEKSKSTLFQMIKKYQIELIAIGNGTASRETESFVSELIKEMKLPVNYVIVNEAGASVYSASELALAELVKIDPKSIGVGQYQHDVTPKKLNETLNFVVTQAVNQVGVNLNTASKSLLMYVSGLNKSSAENIVTHRQNIGRFHNRKDILKVPKLGKKTFEQAVGFLRIPDSNEALDMTSIHPESYDKAKSIMRIYGIQGDMFGKEEVKEIVKDIDKSRLMRDLDIDMYTLSDILDAFIAPLRDPRDQFAQPILRQDILKIEDLTIGMELEGTVRNVVDFGAFIDIGLKEDGLCHISKMAKRFIKHPKDVVAVGDIVKVYVINIDLNRGKVGLSMIKD